MILIVDCGSKKTPYIEEIIDDFNQSNFEGDDKDFFSVE